MAAGILVRKGNPKKIRTLADLTQEGISLLVIQGPDQGALWEGLAERQSLIQDIRKRIGAAVSTNTEAVEKWKTMTELDAWITFESAHYSLKDVADLVRLPGEERICRGTPVVATHFYKNKEVARRFIDFLKTDDCHTLFRKWGWE